MLEHLDIWKLLAGLGIFLYGMHMLEEGVRQLSGRAFKRFIREFTSNRIRAVFAGFTATAVLQSSSAVSLMILAFVGAGIMAMENAIGVILGTNLGTTVTGWIVASFGFKLAIESFALPLIGLGGLGIIFLGRSERYSNISKLLVGFGFLFMGLDYMKLSVENFATQIDMSAFPNTHWLLFLLAGAVLSAMMQSSSVVIAIVLTALNAQLLDFKEGASMVIGANVGTTVTVLLGAIGGNLIKRRVAFSHLSFNLVTALVAVLLLPVLVHLVLNGFGLREDPVIALAVFHTIFNLLGVLLFLPLLRPFVWIILWLFPEKVQQRTQFISTLAPEDVPEASLEALSKEARHLLEEAMRYQLALLQVDERLVFDQPGFKGSDEERYRELKLLQSEIIQFSSRMQEGAMTPEEGERFNRMLHAVRMIMHSTKNVKDVRHNFEEFEQSEKRFLNERYQHYRRRQVDLFLRIHHWLNTETSEAALQDVLETLDSLHREDHAFFTELTQAVRQNKIDDVDVSTTLLVNRAFFHAIRQLLLAMRELRFSPAQLQQFDEAVER
jgi:phosphate:Na+ symporter